MFEPKFIPGGGDSLFVLTLAVRFFWVSLLVWPLNTFRADPVVWGVFEKFFVFAGLDIYQSNLEF